VNTDTLLYERRVIEMTTELRTLLDWFVENYPVVLSEMYAEPCTHFLPPIGQNANLGQWVFWHPESTHLWITKLKLRQSFIEIDNLAIKARNRSNDVYPTNE
jgi:hypothetical protein